MITFPHAKINLGLHVTGTWKTSDTDKGGDGFRSNNQKLNDIKITAGLPLPVSFEGYHTIQSILIPVKLYDILEVTESGDGQTRIFLSGLPVDGDPDDNLCIKAFHMLAAEVGGLPPVFIYLHKNIPPGAGLGGGSADAAFMLRLLNSYFELNLETASLFRLALRLGSDCPFFLQDKPMLATGTGHILDDLAPDPLHGKHLVIVVPPIHVSTAWAYDKIQIDPGSARAKESLKSICQQPISHWQGKLENDFEQIISKHHPRLTQIKNTLQDAGAVYASLTGTGSGVYGVFSTPPTLREMQQIFPGCHVFITQSAVC